MSALALRRFHGGLQRQVHVFRRCQSTDSIIPGVLSPVDIVDSISTIPSQKAPLAWKFARTHFLCIPMDNGTFLERFTLLRDFLKKNAAMAGLHSDMIIPNIKRTCLFRFGQVNIEGFKPNRQPLPNQPFYEMDLVDQVLTKAKMRIDTEINKEELELSWGSVSPMVPFIQREQKSFNPGLVQILNLRAQLNPAWDNIAKIRAIVFDEFKSAGIANVKVRETPAVHLTIINTGWRSRVIGEELQKPRTFNVKTLYTIPGFDQFRTMPLPTADDALRRFTPVDLGKCHVKNFVLEQIGHDRHEIDTEPVIDRSYEFA